MSVPGSALQNFSNGLFVRHHTPFHALEKLHAFLARPNAINGQNRDSLITGGRLIGVDARGENGIHMRWVSILTVYEFCPQCQTNLLERATGLEPALRDGLPTGLENQRATLTPRPRLGTIVAHFGALFC